MWGRRFRLPRDRTHYRGHYWERGCSQRETRNEKRSLFAVDAAPRDGTNYRRVILRKIILVNAAFAALSAWVVNMGAVGHEVGKVEMRVAMAVIFVGLAAHIIYVLTLRRKENMSLVRAAGPALGDRTPDESWLWGVFYHNSQDSALFVEKSSGPGYTVNFGHFRTWLMLPVLLT